MNGLIVDLFAGGGGASTGLAWALGRDPDIAINHDAEALAMHRANHPKYGKALWTPSIHMPRWASRITLEIIDVRVERVQDINESEAQAEGVRPAFSHPGLDGVVSQPSYRWGFWRLWDKLYAERGLGWDVNPWVWAITFRRVESSHGG